MPTQQILSQPAHASIFLTLTIRDGAHQEVADVLTEISGLTRSVSFRYPYSELLTVVGIGAKAWPQLFDAPLPQYLHPFEEIKGAKHTAVSTPGDLFFHFRASTPDLCFEISRQIMKKLVGLVDVADETTAFRYLDSRDLLGFVDGTENPELTEAEEAALTSEELYAGGSYVLVQKYVHDMAAWESLNTEEQERVIGRTKLDNLELDDDEMPSNSHVSLNDLEDDEDGASRSIVRDNLAFGSVAEGEFGTYFIGYARDPQITEDMLRNMFIGNPVGNYDRILDFSTPKTGALFFVPPLSFLDDPESVSA